MNTGSHAQLLPEWLLNSHRNPCSTRTGPGAQQGADSPNRFVKGEDNIYYQTIPNNTNGLTRIEMH